jgi:hypothetical protein
MRTAIISDLHLGSGFGEDIVRDVEIRRLLLDEISAADRLVVLGDALELRELPLARVLEAARPFFEELGEAMAGRPVVLVPGNHDHRLAEPLLEQLDLAGGTLGLEQRDEPAGEAAERIAAWLGEAELQFAYPGLWLRDDVYATHGHYMDCHMSLPRLECIAAAAAMRAFGPLPERPDPTDYERILRPIYGLSFGLAQGGLSWQVHRPSERAWRTISGRNARRGRARQTALRIATGVGVSTSIWTINHLLRARFDPDLSADSISQSGVAAATELAARLDLGAADVITGHTHRGGPGDAEAEWSLPSGGRLHNSGSWVFASAFHHPGTPPNAYWPGTVTWLEDGVAPRRARLLVERPRDELREIVRRLSAWPT